MCLSVWGWVDVRKCVLLFSWEYVRVWRARVRVRDLMCFSGRMSIRPTVFVFVFVQVSKGRDLRHIVIVCLPYPDNISRAGGRDEIEASIKLGAPVCIWGSWVCLFVL